MSHLPEAKLITLCGQLVQSEDWNDPTTAVKVKECAAAVVPLLDHTLLKPEATATDYLALCEQANRYPFASICVPSYWVPFAQKHLKNPDVKLCCVVGFPSGAHSPLIKAEETRVAVEHRAQEIDMVWNLGAVKSGDWKLVEGEIAGVVASATKHVGVKVILETGALTEEEIRIGCTLCSKLGVAFVKTSTGFHPTGGATESTIRLMRKTVGDRCGVKASGGIRDLRSVCRMVVSGANRIGTSAGLSIAEMA